MFCVAERANTTSKEWQSNAANLALNFPIGLFFCGARFSSKIAAFA